MGPEHTGDKRPYSQNRLRRGKIRTLLSKSGITPQDLVYDIGAGDGVISEELARKGARVIAVEKDGRFIARLSRRLADNPLIAVRQGDFLNEVLPAHRPYKVFANIPFILTADIVRKLFRSSHPPDDCYLVMQREAAERFAGVPRECLSSLLLKPWFECDIAHRFRKTDFFPTPKASIVLFHARRRPSPLVTAAQASLYHDFLVYAFRRGKPTVRKAMGKVLTHVQLRRLAGERGFSLEASPRELTQSQWLGLFRLFIASATDVRKGLVCGAERRFLDSQSGRKKVHRTHRSYRRSGAERGSARPYGPGVPML